MKKTLCLLMSCCLIFSSCSKTNQTIEEKPRLNNPITENKFNKSQIFLLELHNKERKIRKIEQLVLDEDLCTYAQKHAETMANKNSLYHSKMSNLMKASNGASLVGENIAWGQKTEEEVVNSWMWSPMHKLNILGKNYKKVGFGLAKNKDGKVYWCTVFSNKEV